MEVGPTIPLEEESYVEFSHAPPNGMVGRPTAESDPADEEAKADGRASTS
jgi:hypothetical protein